MYKTTELFDLEHTIAKDLLSSHEYPWEVLQLIKEEILKLGEQLDKNEYKKIKENVWAHVTAKIADSAYIDGPTIIGKDTEIRHCAYIRGSALVGDGCVIGNSCELKNTIIFDGCQVPHFNYVGDSILGYKAHMGAGSIVYNIKSDKHNVVVKDEEEIQKMREASLLNDKIMGEVEAFVKIGMKDKEIEDFIYSFTTWKNLIIDSLECIINRVFIRRLYFL